jgi:FG-GAP repeat
MRRWAARAAVGAALLTAPRPAHAAGERAKVVFDRWGMHPAVVVERRGKQVQRMTLDGLDLVLNLDLDPRAPRSIRFTDFDGDGHPDLVVRTPAPGVHRVWLVFPFDARTGRYRARPMVYCSQGSRPLGSPAPGYRAELLSDCAQAGMTVDPPPRALADLVVIHEGGRVAQTLQSHQGTLIPASGAEDGSGLVTSIDVDFDGRPDLVLFAGGSAIRSYVFWRFDPETKRFVYAPALGKLANPTLDPRRREIREWEGGGNAGAIHRVARHRFAHGKLQKIWELRQGWDGDDRAVPGLRRAAGMQERASLLLRRVSLRVDGRMHEICRGLVDAGQAWDDPVFIARGDRAACADPPY